MIATIEPVPERGKMLKRGLAIAIGLAGLALVPAPAQSASFDCAKARSADEVAVCGNRTLSELDREMGGLWYAYARVPMLMGGNGARMDEARAFLARRRACAADTACLAAAYRVRIAELKRAIDSAMADYARFVTG